MSSVAAPASLRQCWHPVARVEDLQGAPLATTLLDEPLVVFASGTDAACLRDLCVHRGTALSRGTVVDGCIVCPYHGWRYDAAGRCVLIPQLGEGAQLPPKARAFPCRSQVRHGLVWVLLAEPASEPPLLDYPEWDSTDFLSAHCETYVWETSAARMVENFTDFAHFAFVHPGILGDPEAPEVPHHDVTRDGDRLRYRIQLEAPGGRGRVVDVDAATAGPVGTQLLDLDYEVLVPFSLRVVRREHGEIVRATHLAVQPIGATSCRAYVSISLRRDPSPGGEERLADLLRRGVEAQAVIERQDRVIVQTQRPQELPVDLGAELHLRFDRVAVGYRRLMGELHPEVGA